MTGWDILKRDVIDEGLCTRCGSCIGVCPRHALTIGDPLGACLPTLVGDCRDCAAPCLVGCPGLTVDFPKLNAMVFPGQRSDYLMGVTREQFVAYAGDPELRAQGASGGVMTAINARLLETGQVDGVVSLVVTDDAPLRPRPVIATDAKTLLLGQQSKYSIAPTNTILAELAAFDGVVSYVALPCQVHSIRKLQAQGHPAARKIKVLIGSYCGMLMYFDSVRDLVAKLGVTDLGQIERLEYRAGEWPGKTRITLRNGTTFELDKFYANYMNLFYPVERCLTCTDLTSEFADISAGDAWAPVYEERGLGFSLLVTRTPVGEAVVHDCITAGTIVTTPIRREDAIAMHSHSLDNKKNGGFLRIQHLKAIGRKTPDYGYRPVSFLWTRRVIALVMSVAFVLGRTRAARRLVLLLPLEMVGKWFKRARTVWKGLTSPEKKRGISSYEVITHATRDELVDTYDRLAGR